jgi:predicted RNase H-like nuclease
MRLVGLDCATAPRNTGLAVATLTPAGVEVHEARVGQTREGIVDALVGWLGEADDAVLALDAPLGWPAPMAALASHAAGDVVEVEPNAFFRRETDRVVQRTIRKTPLDVGADRIARTAHVALSTLAAVRQRVPVGLGWTPGTVAGRQAIEVYPAATLIGRGLSPRGYKAADAHARRAEVMDALGIVLAPDVRARAVATDHVLDAILCCVAAADYARGTVRSPEDSALARREGWIWF